MTIKHDLGRCDVKIKDTDLIIIAAALRFYAEAGTNVFKNDALSMAKKIDEALHLNEFYPKEAGV